MKFQYLPIILTLGFETLSAHPFDVLETHSVGRDATEFKQEPHIASEAYTILVDGSITSKGTEAISYDRTLTSVLSLWGGWPVSSNLFIRPKITANGNLQKNEGADVPRTLTESYWSELLGRIEATFVTQNSLEVFIGLTIESHFARKLKSESTEVTTEDSYDAATLNYPHLGVVKRRGGFEGGFYFVSGAEKARRVRKLSNGDDSVFYAEDRVFQPTSIGIFSRWTPSNGVIYGEFAAVQASEGGNKTDDGGTVEEDYVRFLIGGDYSLLGRGELDLISSLIYKSLSYSDNRNVSIPTMPMLGGRLGVGSDQGGFPIKVGINFVYGNDGQSIEEFNAEYKIRGLGLWASAEFTF